MRFYSTPLVQLTREGLYCEAGGFYIDPKRAVDLAIVTHAHSDHARRGSKKYICASSGVGLLKTRLGKKICVEGVPYQQSFILGRARVSLHSAGHILGSAQVRIECDGEVWVASGDYKRDPDPSCDAFEVVPCDTFITEATFGTPKYAWPKNAEHGRDIFSWWCQNQASGHNSILFGYSLGKAQRILAELAPHAKRSVLIHESVHELTECYRAEGRFLAATRRLDEAIQEACGSSLKEELILAPPSILNHEFKKYLGKYRTAFASGWMQNFSPYAGNRYDQGFVMSDHADWNDLNLTVRETGAQRVFVQHRNGQLIRHLRGLGLKAYSDEDLILENHDRLGGREMSLFEAS